MKTIALLISGLLFACSFRLSAQGNPSVTTTASTCSTSGTLTVFPDPNYSASPVTDFAIYPSGLPSSIIHNATGYFTSLAAGSYVVVVSYANGNTVNANGIVSGNYSYPSNLTTTYIGCDSAMVCITGGITNYTFERIDEVYDYSNPTNKHTFVLSSLTVNSPCATFGSLSTNGPNIYGYNTIHSLKIRVTDGCGNTLLALLPPQHVFPLMGGAYYNLAGYFIVHPVGGIGPYQYSLSCPTCSPSPIYMDSIIPYDTLVNYCAPDITIYDRCGMQFTIPYGDILFYPHQKMSVTLSCNTIGDSIESVISNGLPPFTVTYGAITVITNSRNITLPRSCNNEIIVTDQCQRQISAFIQFNCPQLTVSAGCVNFTQGTATILAAGGVPPYTFRCTQPINTTNNTGNFSGLITAPSGNRIFQFTVSDACGNTKSLSVQEATQCAGCNVQCTSFGNITLKPHGNQAPAASYPITYNCISPPGTISPQTIYYGSAYFTGLLPGVNYVFTMLDACGNRDTIRFAGTVNATFSAFANYQCNRVDVQVDVNSTGFQYSLYDALAQLLAGPQSSSTFIANETNGVCSAPLNGNAYQILVTSPLCGSKWLPINLPNKSFSLHTISTCQSITATVSNPPISDVRFDLFDANHQFIDSNRSGVFTSTETSPGVWSDPLQGNTYLIEAHAFNCCSVSDTIVMAGQSEYCLSPIISYRNTREYVDYSVNPPAICNQFSPAPNCVCGIVQDSCLSLMWAVSFNSPGWLRLLQQVPSDYNPLTHHIEPLCNSNLAGLPPDGVFTAQNCNSTWSGYVCDYYLGPDFGNSFIGGGTFYNPITNCTLNIQAPQDAIYYAHIIIDSLITTCINNSTIYSHSTDDGSQYLQILSSSYPFCNQPSAYNIAGTYYLWHYTPYGWEKVTQSGNGIFRSGYYNAIYAGDIYMISYEFLSTSSDPYNQCVISTSIPFIMPPYATPAFTATATNVCGTTGSISCISSGTGHPFRFTLLNPPPGYNNPVIYNNGGNTASTFTNLPAGTYIIENRDTCGNTFNTSATIYGISPFNPVATIGCDSTYLHAPSFNGAAYVWTMNGHVVATQSDTVLNLTNSGIYSVEVTLGNCVYTASCNTALNNLLCPKCDTSCHLIVSINNQPTPLILNDTIVLNCYENDSVTFSYSCASTSRNTFIIHKDNGVFSNNTITSADVSFPGIYHFGLTKKYIRLNGDSVFCDSTDIIIKMECPPLPCYIEDTVTALICNGDSLWFHNKKYSQPGIYLDTVFLHLNGICDTAFSVIVEWNQPSKLYDTSVICFGGIIQYHGQVINQPGTYADTINNSTQQGCDSIQYHTVRWRPIVTIYDSVEICIGDTVNKWGRKFATPGIYSVPYNNFNQLGCDSLIEIQVSLRPALRTFDTVSICKGGSYDVHGVSISAPGNYADTVNGMATPGCDTIRYITITVNSVVIVYDTHSICMGDTIKILGHNYTMEGTFSDTINGALKAGCDSLLVETILVKPRPSASISLSQSNNFCSGLGNTLTASGGTTFIWSTGGSSNTISVQQSGIYRVTVTDQNGCTASTEMYDSIPPLLQTTKGGTHYICKHASTNLCVAANGGMAPYTYSWPNGTASSCANLSLGTYQVTVTDANGCTTTSKFVVTQKAPMNCALLKLTRNPSGTVCCGTQVIHTVTPAIPQSSYVWFEDGVIISGAHNNVIQRTVPCSNGMHIYMAVAIDSCGNMCVLKDTVNVSKPIATITQLNTLCKNQCALLVGSGGCNIFSYQWSGVGYTPSPLFLRNKRRVCYPGGHVNLTVRDCYGCTASTSTNVQKPPVPTIASATPNFTSCWSANNILTATGYTGTGIYWKDQSSGQIISTTNTANTGVMTFPKTFLCCTTSPCDTFCKSVSVSVCPITSPGCCNNTTNFPHPVTVLYAEPNPFQVGSNIHYVVIDSSEINLSVYDIEGRLISNFIDNTNMPPGSYEYYWDTRLVSTGLYTVVFRSSIGMSTILVIKD